MYDATILHGGATVFSPWFPRGGDFVKLTVEGIQVTGASTLEISLYHKDSADPGSGADVDSGGTKKLTLSAVGRTSVDWAKSSTITGLKELVRYRFQMNGSGSDAIRFRTLAPIWYDAVAEP